nr:cadherin repeat domain-containing protein [Alphaproteobacteria bacterium]
MKKQRILSTSPSSVAAESSVLAAPSSGTSGTGRKGNSSRAALLARLAAHKKEGRASFGFLSLMALAACGGGGSPAGTVAPTPGELEVTIPTPPPATLVENDDGTTSATIAFPITTSNAEGNANTTVTPSVQQGSSDSTAAAPDLVYDESAGTLTAKYPGVYVVEVVSTDDSTAVTESVTVTVEGDLVALDEADRPALTLEQATTETGEAVQIDPYTLFRDDAAITIKGVTGNSGVTWNSTTGQIEIDQSAIGSQSDDPVTVTVTAESANDTEAVVMITLNSDDIEAISPTTAGTAPAGGALSIIDAAALFSDADTTQTKTYSITDKGGLEGLTIDPVTGAITFLDATTSIDQLPNEETSYTIVIEASDGFGTATVTYTLTLSGNAFPLGDTNAALSSTFTGTAIDLSALFVDEDSSATGLQDADGETFTLSVAAATGNTLTVSDGTSIGYTFNTGTNQFTLIGDVFPGDYTFNVLADDGAGGITTVAYALTVPNENPEAVSASPAATYQRSAIDLSTLFVDKNSSTNGLQDDDGDTFTLSVAATGSNALSESDGSSIGYTFDDGTNEFTLIGEVDADDYTFNVIANDGRGGVTTVAYTLTVPANTDPVATNATAASTGTSIDLAALFTDADSGAPGLQDNDGDTFTVTITPTGTNALDSSQYSTTGTQFSLNAGVAADTYTFNVIADDGRQGKTTVVYTLTVPANNAPGRSATGVDQASGFDVTSLFLDTDPSKIGVQDA